MSFEDDALNLFKKWLDNGVEVLIVYDLIDMYKAECDFDNDWATKDALRKVIRLYTNDNQYAQFKREVGIDEG